MSQARTYKRRSSRQVPAQPAAARPPQVPPAAASAAAAAAPAMTTASPPTASRCFAASPSAPAAARKTPHTVSFAGVAPPVANGGSQPRSVTGTESRATTRRSFRGSGSTHAVLSRATGADADAGGAFRDSFPLYSAVGFGRPAYMAALSESAKKDLFLSRLWASLSLLPWETTPHKDIVVMPNFEPSSDSGAWHIEESALSVLSSLRLPGTRIIYITSMPLDPEIIAYHLALMPNIGLVDAAMRVLFLSAQDPSPRPLADKLRSRPGILSRVRSIVRKGALLSAFAGTPSESDLAVRLGAHLHGGAMRPNTDQGLFFPSERSFCFSVFRGVGLPHALTSHHTVFSVGDLIYETIALLESAASRTAPVPAVRLFTEAGLVGTVDIADTARAIARGDADSAALFALCEEAFESSFVCETDWAKTWVDFSAALADDGALVQIAVDKCAEVADLAMSHPSVDLVVDEEGTVEVWSTQELIYAGSSVVGCRGPARDPYRRALTDFGFRVGRYLAAQGGAGCFSVEALAVHNAGAALPGVVAGVTALGDAEGEWTLMASRVRYQRSMATLPMSMVRVLVGGALDPKTALLHAGDQEPRAYVSFHSHTNDAYAVFSPNDVIEHLVEQGLHFAHDTKVGVVCHVLGAVADSGRLGLTAIAKSPEEAALLYHDAIDALDARAEEWSEIV